MNILFSDITERKVISKEESPQVQENLICETVSNQGKLKNFSCILRGACKRKNFVGSHLPKYDKLSTRTVEQDFNALTLTKDNQYISSSTCKSDSSHLNQDKVHIEKSIFSSISPQDKDHQPSERVRKSKVDFNPTGNSSCSFDYKSKIESEDKSLNEQVKSSKTKTTGSCTSSR